VTFKKIGKVVYVAVMMAVLGYGAFSLYGLNMIFWERLAGLVAAPGVGTMSIIVGSGLLLPVLSLVETRSVNGRPWMNWGLFHRNINFVPMDYVYLRIPFLVLLYFNLPVLAWVEEMTFRHDWILHGTSGWLDAIWRSAAFAILHVAGGAKIRALIPLAMAGMWFSWHYLQSGVEAATLAHLSLNTISLTAMLLIWARNGRNPFTQ
jgi:hypothetical protein